MNDQDWTILECLTAAGELIDLYYDETRYYIKRRVEELSDKGYYDFKVVANPKDLDLWFINLYS